MSEMTPREIVSELDKHIIGQDNAKRSVAIALRNRWRRMQLNEELRHEVTPKNILMIGPTGVGKTEIARRLAKLANAPFIKVEAPLVEEVVHVAAAEGGGNCLVDIRQRHTHSLGFRSVDVHFEHRRIFQAVRAYPDDLIR